MQNYANSIVGKEEHMKKHALLLLLSGSLLALGACSGGTSSSEPGKSSTETTSEASSEQPKAEVANGVFNYKYEDGFGVHGSYNNKDKERPLAQVENPSYCISFMEMLCDYAYPLLVYYSYNQYYPYYAQNFHGNGNNLLMCDGHVEPFRFVEGQSITHDIAIEQKFWTVKAN